MYDASDRLLLRIPEVAERLSVGRSTIYELVNANLLPTVRIGRAVRIPAAALRDWVERQAIDAARDLTPAV